MRDGLRVPAQAIVDALLRERNALEKLARALHRSETEDLVQEVWLAALTNPPRADEHVRAWARTVLRRTASRLLLARRNQQDAETAWAEERRGAYEPIESWIEHEDALVRVADLLARLTPVHREALRLHYVEELTARAAAKVARVPYKTFRTRLYRAVERVRRDAQELEEESRRDSSRRASRHGTGGRAQGGCSR